MPPRPAHTPRSALWSTHLALLTLALPGSLALVLRFADAPWRAQLTMQWAYLGQALALAWFVTAVYWAWTRWVNVGNRLRLACAAFASFALCAWLLPESFASFADRVSTRVPAQLTSWLLVLLTSLSLPLALWLGGVWARPRWRWAALSVALAAVTPNDFVLAGNYRGLHSLLTLVGGLLACGALAGLQAPGWAWLDKSWAKKAVFGVQLAPRALFAAVSVGLALTALLLPPERTRQAIAALDGAPLGQVVARSHAAFGKRQLRERALRALRDEDRQWFSVRDKLPPIPPSSPALLPKDSLVILITIDALRADVVKAPRKERLPFLHWLAQEGVTFTLARSPGAGTVPSLSSMYSGRHFSQMWWARTGTTEWPDQDFEPRFPELLQKEGVHTLTFTPLLWLLNSHRIAAGFDEEDTLDKNRTDRRKLFLSTELLPMIRERLQRGLTGVNFLSFHLLDCHAPYDSGEVKTGSNKGRYVSELERLNGELQTLRSFIEQQPFGDRVTWIVTADHGEAFGEHNTQQHLTTVYEELLRVPLWIKVPGVAPRSVTAPVSIIDIGPTVLDLFGVPTPSSFMGQSLVPLLRGESVTLTRPIAAEARLRQTIVFPDGMKAIRDLNNGSRELYDLKTDPGERNNLIDQGDEKYQALLDLFFDTHQNPRYETTAPRRQ